MISEFFINRPVLANVLAIVIVILGAVALVTLPVAQYPNIDGVVPLLAAWRFDEGDPAARQWHERVFIHMLKMLAMALNERFHAKMRGVLGPHVVAGEGVMARNKDGSWRLTPEKGVARMVCKQLTDHAREPGCRPGFNIDVLRVLAVCKTPATAAPMRIFF